jgi:predicted ArsR family transcriptional regulator
MLQVHPNTVRFHLDTLVSTGRVEQVAPDRKGPGRPALMFRAPRRMDRGGTTRTAGKEESIELLVDLLDDLGFAPERRGEEQVGLRHCPFPELVETRKAVICSIHQGIMQGALETGERR